MKRNLLLNLLAAAVVTVTTSTTYAASRTTTYTYNNVGQVLTIDGPRTDISDITTTTYDAQGNRSSITNALGHTTTINSHDASGRPLTLTDANGIQTTLSYDVRGRLISKTVAPGTPDVATTTFSHDNVGQITRITLPNGAHLNYSYDAAHRLTGISDNLGNTLTYTLDAMGNRTQEDITDPQGNLTQTQARTYNSLNRLTQTIGASAQTTSYSYDAQGNPTQTQDALLRNSGSGFDALNRLIVSTNTEGNNSNYSYDPLDNLIAVTDPKGLTTSYTTNAFGDVLVQNSPDTGTTTNTYDNAGNTLTSTDAKGITTTYSYDALNRLTSISYPDASNNITYSYDSATNHSCTHGIGRLCAVTEPSGTTAYQYDSRGNPTAQITTLAGINRSIHYTYDVADNLIQTTYPNGRTLDYGRDSAGRIIQVTTTANGITDILASGIDYQPFGPLKTLDYGNGLQETRSYDLDARLTNLDTSAALSRSYTYDAVNNITSISNLLDTTRSESFTYDLMDRLNLAAGIYGNLSYTYDSNGNRTSETQDTQTKTYNYAATNHQLNGITDDTTSSIEDSRSYDANGNTTSITNNNDTISLNYDDNNRLSQTSSNQTTASYSHNARGQRSIKQSTTSTSSNTTLYYYNQTGQLIAELDGNGNTLREILWLDNKPLALITAGTTASNTDPAIQILDNDNGTATGSWRRSTLAPGYEGSNYQYHNAYGSIKDDRRASFTGDWTVSTEVDGFEGSHYRYHATGIGSNTATWTLHVPTTGNYNVYAKWTADANHASNAPYTINHSAGGGPTSSTVTVNQQVNGGQFNLLGTYTFSSGTTTVSLSDQADGYVIADAIQIVPVNATPNTFIWTPEITEAGEYTISVRWPAGASRHDRGTLGTNRASNAPYTIHHSNGDSTHIVNQQQNGATYNLLGTYTLDANSRITLTDQADGYVIADAIKIEQTANPPGTTQPEIHYIHSDHLNTPQRITNTAQQTVWAADYQPFGEASITTASITNPLRFPGQYYDEETNLHYNYFRDYDPTTGRYIQSDPIGLAGGLNTYGYVGGNPVTRIDPTGENWLLKEVIKKLLKDNRKSKKTKKGANKNDRKQVSDAARNAGIPKDRRRDFGDYLEKIKREEGRGGRDNFDFDELRDLAKEFKDTQCP